MLEVPNYKFLIHASSCSIRRTAKTKTKRLYNEVACGGIVHGLRISTNGEIQLRCKYKLHKTSSRAIFYKFSKLENRKPAKPWSKPDAFN